MPELELPELPELTAIELPSFLEPPEPGIEPVIEAAEPPATPEMAATPAPRREILLAYQKRFVHFCDDNRYVAVLKGRQSGFTFALALWAVRRRLKKNTDCYYVSRVERSAKLFAAYCAKWARIFNVIVQSEVIREKDITTTTLSFPNGSKIQVMPSGENVVRGLPGDVILDEAAYAEDAAAFYDATFPTTQAGHSFIIVSTRGYDGCWFNGLFDKADKADSIFKPFKCLMDDAVNEGLADLMPGDHHQLPPGPERNKAFVAFIKRGMTEESYAQEYNGVARGLGGLIKPEYYDRQAVFPLYDSIEALVTARMAAKQSIGELFVGVDLAFTTDHAGVWVLERQYDPTPGVPEDQRVVYVSVVNKSWAKTPPQALKIALRPFLQHPNVVKAVIDQGGVGYVLALDLQQEFGGIVQPLAVSNPVKAEVFERLLFFLQTDRLGLFEDQPELRTEFMSVRRTLTPGGSVSYDYGTPDGHGDNCCACAYALYGAEHDKADVALTTRQ